MANKQKRLVPCEMPFMELYREVKLLFDRQMNRWDTARHNHLALNNLERRTVYLFAPDGSSLTFALQHNPERRRSAAAPAAGSTAGNACFLCDDNQPPEQEAVGWKTQWHEYRLQLNPYPILHNHLTIKDFRHVPQRLTSHRLDDMVKLSVDLPGWLVFFNGARCGASAPHHFHFQAGLPGDVPLCRSMAKRHFTPRRPLYSSDDTWMEIVDTAGRFGLAGSSATPLETHRLMDSALLAVAMATGDDDPAVNALTWCAGGRGYFALFPRRRHRPSCYGEDENQRLVSPATLEMAGLWPLPRKEDFATLTGTELRDICHEVCVDTATATSIVAQLKTIL